MEKEMAPHSSTLAWKIPWTEEPGRLHSVGGKESDMTEDFTFTFHFHALEKEMATHSSVLAWRIPGTGEPGGLLSMGSHRVGRNWSDLAAAAWLSMWSILLNLPHAWKDYCDVLCSCKVKVVECLVYIICVSHDCLSKSFINCWEVC